MRVRLRGLTKLVFCSLILIASISSTRAQLSNDIAKKRSAEKAWEALVKVKGGRDKLNSIANILTERESVTRLDVFPFDVWEFKGPFFGTKFSNLHDGRNSFRVSANQYGETDNDSKDPYEYLALERVIWLLETKYDKPEILGISRRKEGKKTFDIVEAKVGSLRIDFAYEPEEMLVRRIYFHRKEGTVWQFYVLDDYKVIDGIQMPHQWDRKSLILDKDLTDFNFSSINFKFNVEYDPDIFKRPLKATTADAWKPKTVKDHP